MTGLGRALVIVRLQTITVPFTAWEQAVFVVLLIFLVIIMLRWQSRESKANRDFQSTVTTQMLQALAKRDVEWRQWMEDQHKYDNQRLEAVQGALEVLAALVQDVDTHIAEHRAEFKVHDEKEWAKIEEMGRVRASRRSSKE